MHCLQTTHCVHHVYLCKSVYTFCLNCSVVLSPRGFFSWVFKRETKPNNWILKTISYIFKTLAVATKFWKLSNFASIKFGPLFWVIIQIWNTNHENIKPPAVKKNNHNPGQPHFQFVLALLFCDRTFPEEFRTGPSDAKETRRSHHLVHLQCICWRLRKWIYIWFHGKTKDMKQGQKCANPLGWPSQWPTDDSQGVLTKFSRFPTSNHTNIS